MKKIFSRFAVIAVSCIIAISALVGCAPSAEEEGPGGNNGGTTEPPVIAGEAEKVTILYNGTEAGETIDLVYDDSEGAENKYSFGVKVESSGTMDEVEQMVFWTSDNSAVAELTDNDSTADVILQGKKGTVTIAVYSLLHSDTVYDTLTINVTVPAKPIAKLTGFGAYTIEAENADLSDCQYGGTAADGTIIETPDPAKCEVSGGKNIGNLNKKGNKVVFCIESEKEAEVNMSLRLASGVYRSNDSANMLIDFSKVCKVTVNEEEFKTGIHFQVYDKDTWFKYNEYSANGNFILQAGVNYIVFEVLTDANPTNTNTKMPNIDYMKLNVVKYDGKEPEITVPTVESVTIKNTEGEEVASSIEHIYSESKKTITLTADVAVKGGAETTVNWDSSNTAVATVENGTVTFTGKAGTVTIRAVSTVDTSKSDAVSIKVIVPLSVISGAGSYRLEAEAATMKNAKIETVSEANKKNVRIYTPTEANDLASYQAATAYTMSGWKNSSMNALNSSLTFNVWCESDCKATVIFCMAPSANTKSKDYSYDFDKVVSTVINGGAPVKTGITVKVPTKAITDATGIGCWYYYAVYETAVEVDLKAGLNTIVLTTLTEGYTNLRTPNMDYIELKVK